MGLEPHGSAPVAPVSVAMSLSHWKMPINPNICIWHKCSFSSGLLLSCVPRRGILKVPGSVVECVPGMCEALSSIPVLEKKKKKEAAFISQSGEVFRGLRGNAHQALLPRIKGLQS